MGANSEIHPVAKVFSMDPTEMLTGEMENNPFKDLIQEELNPLELSPSSQEVNKEENEKDKPSQGGDNNPDDKNIPFHEHPRFKELVNEKNEYKRQLEENSKRMDEMQKMFDSYRQPLGDKVEIPEEFKTLWGIDDPGVYQNLSSLIQKEAARLYDERNRLVEEQRQKEQEESTKQQEYIKSLQNEYDTKVTTLAKENDVDRNLFLTWFKENPILDKNGEDYNFEKGIEIFKAINTPKTSRKELAGDMSGGSKDTTPSKFPTLSQLEKKTWNQLGK